MNNRLFYNAHEQSVLRYRDFVARCNDNIFNWAADKKKKNEKLKDNENK